MTPTLIATVDTEEEGLWGGKYPASGNTVRNIDHVGPFQSLCDEFKIRPTYLVTAPVVEDAKAIDTLAAIAHDGRCEIGTHVHPWCNPPFDDRFAAETYLCNLPEQLQLQKIEWLTDRITERVGVRPTSFRAGRYGLDAVGLRILEQLNYRVDSSVIPFTDYTKQRGPDFSRAPAHPYHPDASHLSRVGPRRGILELPVTVGYARGDFPRNYAMQRLLSKQPWRSLRIEGILDRLRLLRQIKLSPEKSSGKDMLRLLDRCGRLQIPAAVLMFHSSSLLAGASPYVRNESDRVAFLARLSKVFAYCTGLKGAGACTLSEYAVRQC